MSVPSMVHRLGDTLVVRSVVSGDTLYGSGDDLELPEQDCSSEVTYSPPHFELPECKVKRNYSCASCDYFTQNPRNYLYHLRDVHKEKVKIYECPECLYASKHFQKLLRHTKMVHGAGTVPKKDKRRIVQNVLSSEESNDSVPSNDDEEAQPAEKNNLKCSLCAFTAKSQIQLTKHEREEHIKTKFFRCTKCTYVTHMKARFTKHVKYHTMPMIKCDMCDFRTPYKWNLDRHCKNHNGKGAFKCSACNFTAEIKQSLTVHEMNHHVPPVGQAAGFGIGRRRNKVGASDSTLDETITKVQTEPAPCENFAKSKPKLKIPPPKKFKQENISGDFVHPDDIVQHASGNVYIKTKCKWCNYKTAWDSEMTRHEEQVHATPKKRPCRPVPNLIPISPRKHEDAMSQRDINEICARSANSSLKDFASLFGSEDVFADNKNNQDQPVVKNEFGRKNESFFDKLKEKLSGEASEILTCKLCGHKSKCLTESCAHSKVCGKEPINLNFINTVHKLSSTRCQHCRQRCKSSKDLFNHLKTCEQAAKYYNQNQEDDDSVSVDDQLQIITEEEGNSKEPHPMENKVFVWNNIEVPMDVEVEESNQYEYIDDNASLDLSIRTQSPISEVSNASLDVPNTNINNNNNHISNNNNNNNTQVIPVNLPDKVPTHGNDISVAQHKRVFKCPHCTFWASTASRFHVHIVGHLNKKPFECSLCAYRSNWRWDITKHIKLKSVRDPAHESAKVLMTDETGRRNYTKYNKYLTEINSNNSENQDKSKSESAKSKNSPDSKPATLRPPPPLKSAEEFLNRDKKRASQDGKKTLWQCKKCNFRDPCREKLLVHVKGHYSQTSTSNFPSPSSSGNSGNYQTLSGGGLVNEESDEASVGGGGLTRGQAPFRCGHCQQVSNWKHVIQRHCRLKHSGDIKVIVGTKSSEKMEIEVLPEDLPEQADIEQTGTFKCTHCPFSNEKLEEYQTHQEGHNTILDNTLKCVYCNFHVHSKEDLTQHLKLHGVNQSIEVLQKIEVEPSKRYKCNECPYVTNSKSQFMYHKQFHESRTGQYSCSQCNYNVSKRHLLHQHMRVHGINISPQKQNGETIDFEDINDEIEEVQFDWKTLTEIPLVWVSKGEKFSKMYKCRYCPHVNLRKVNIQEHEKMHGWRDKNQGRSNDGEHHCTDCNYVCNNAGVLSSHSKVHQGLYGVVHGIVDVTKTDAEQIRELGKSETKIYDEADEILFSCNKCPARFLKENEFNIHVRLHNTKGLYKCDKCTYSAKLKSYLLAHAKVHTKEYQERSKYLITNCRINPDYPPPEVIENDEVWLVDENDSDYEMENDYSRNRFNIPLSGTELFQQKSEAEANEKLSPNSKNRDKKFKCPKCPTTFDKKDNFKMHLGLHGSKQQYKCDQCDFSVKYYNNFLQHLNVHNEESPKLQIDETSSNEGDSTVVEEKKQFWCSMCPYTNLRKDLVDNHQKRHVVISGIQNNYTCQHCDFSVPQLHLLRDHTKLHFKPQKMQSPEAYMSAESLTLQVFTNEGESSDMCFDNDLNLNNNEGERVYVKKETGEVAEKSENNYS